MDDEPRIADHAFLSDCSSAALVTREGTVDWWCVPRFDSPSVFGRLLGPDAGHWTLRPDGDFTLQRSYIPDSLVLRTELTTATGTAVLTEALAFERGARGHDVGLLSPRVLIRRLEGTGGTVDLRCDVVPRLEYGLTVPHVTACDGGAEFRGGPVVLLLESPVGLTLGDGSAHAAFTVADGEVVEFRLGHRPAYGDVGRHVPPAIDDTVEGWRSWAADHTAYEGRHADAVRRSAVVLQGLTYQPSGAVIAAATSSLPEDLGTDLTWDYRFAWLRDLSLTIRALWVAACPDEAARLFRWIADATGVIGDGPVQIMYGVEGERDLSETELAHLPGYAKNGPVRIGNAAWDQRQLDVLGEVLDAAHQLRDNLGELDGPTRQLLVALADRAASSWQQPDSGMWEARDAERHYTSSKVMCWVALDRALSLAPALGDDVPVTAWERARDEIRETVLAEAWCDEVGAYAGALGSDELDASVLLLPLVGFLEARDERMWATVLAVEERLGDTGLVRRWRDDPQGFLICTFWLVECLALGGELERAETWFDRAASFANDVGLMAEVADPSTGELLGNFPQAFSHVGLINAAWCLTDCARR